MTTDTERLAPAIAQIIRNWLQSTENAAALQMELEKQINTTESLDALQFMPSDDASEHIDTLKMLSEAIKRAAQD